MKPGNHPNTIAVLNTVPECRVLLDAIEDPEYLRQHAPFAPQTLDNIAVRFCMQTLNPPRTSAPDAHENVKFRMDPEFSVRRNEFGFVMNAAIRVVSAEKFGERLSHRLSGRTEAANRILRFLPLYLAHGMECDWQ